MSSKPRLDSRVRTSCASLEPSIVSLKVIIIRGDSLPEFIYMGRHSLGKRVPKLGREREWNLEEGVRIVVKSSSQGRHTCLGNR
ncbi:hypothetical protein J6590_060267 [Homalodisca vitripennis]|nr:hypothetical protein J6590_060267 [Homalodisca vitripennis]